MQRAKMSTLGMIDPEASNPYLRNVRSSHLWPTEYDAAASMVEARAILAETEPVGPAADNALRFHGPLAYVHYDVAEDCTALLDSLSSFLAAPDPIAYLAKMNQ